MKSATRLTSYFVRADGSSRRIYVRFVKRQTLLPVSLNTVSEPHLVNSVISTTDASLRQPLIWVTAIQINRPQAATSSSSSRTSVVCPPNIDNYCPHTLGSMVQGSTTDSPPFPRFSTPDAATSRYVTRHIVALPYSPPLHCCQQLSLARDRQ
jgi:hypothetical protein